MNIILYMLGALIVGIVITYIICYYLPQEKIRSTNQALEKEEQQVQLHIKDLEKKYLEEEKELQQKKQKVIEEIQLEQQNWDSKNIQFLKAEINLKANIANLEGQIEEKKKTIKNLSSQADLIAEEMVDKSLDTAILNYEQKLTTEKNNYLIATENARNEYYNMIKEFQNYYNNYSSQKEQEMIQLQQQIEEAKAKTNAIIEVNKRAELEKTQKDFYRLQLSNVDIEEIQKIRSIEPYLRQKEPLNKVIWKVYYEKPYTDLIGRVIGPKIKMGIYKITNINNGKVYIGQAVNIAERWRQHIKRGVGADPPTQNKLYPAMLEEGVENFTFEIVEECPANKLTEREKYYTDIFNAQSYGYVVKKG